MTLLSNHRANFHANLKMRLLRFVATKKNGRNARNADASNRASCEVANALAECLGAEDGETIAGQTIGNLFEDEVSEFVDGVLRDIRHLQIGNWITEREKSRSPLVIARFSQYSHLKDVYEASKDNPDLAAVLGRDYSVASDVLIYRQRLTDVEINKTTDLVTSGEVGKDHLRSKSGSEPYLHASVSCKWTIRSDRAQNARTEALDLIRKRKGRVPHIVAVTAEPLPSRLSSLCLGTGDLDCVYHFALPELVKAVDSLGQSEASELLDLMIKSERIKDIVDLPLDLVL